jgi:hypothetical protein
VTTSSGVDPAAGFGVWSLDDTPMRAPSWVRAFTRVGRELAGTGTAAVGSASRLVVLSVPTGQYAAWAIAAGALGAPPRLVSPVEPGVYRCATWVEESRQVADADVVVSEEGLGVEYRVGTTRYLEGWPVVVLPVGMPDSRLQRTSLTRAERDRIRAAVTPIMPRSVPWYRWWAGQCISPVVLVGDGGEHLLRQRSELLRVKPGWVWSTSGTLLGVDVASVRHADRVLHHPFSIVSPDACRRLPWLRAIRPRLVVYTSWSAYQRRHAAAFAGSPTVVLANRRVASSLRCAAETDQRRLPDGGGLVSVGDLPRGIQARVLAEPVVADDGEVEDDGGCDHDD